MNENILSVANASIQTRGFLQALRGADLSARLLPDAGSTLAVLKYRRPAQNESSALGIKIILY
jgi:hypothetical protein